MLFKSIRNWLFGVRGDKDLFIAFLALIAISVIFIFTSTTVLANAKQGGNLNHYPFNHILFLLISWIITTRISRCDPKIFNRFALFIFVVGLGLAATTIFFGVSYNGSTRWLRIAGVQFQPSEVAKISLVFFVAKILSIHKNNPSKALKPILIATALIIGPIISQNLSTAILIVTTVGLMMIIGHVPMKKLLFIIALGAAAVWGYLEYAPENLQIPRLQTWKARFERFFSDSNEDDAGKNYQARQAELAVAHSGFLGTGPGRSYVKNFLPMSYSDFIYSTILEEWGAWGGLGVIGIFLWIFRRILLISNRLNSAFEKYLILGLGIIICLQAFINMAVGSGLIPVTGQTLPLISMGGTSNVIVGTVFGVIFCISANAEPEVAKQKDNATVAPHVEKEMEDDDIYDEN